MYLCTSWVPMRALFCGLKSRSEGPRVRPASWPVKGAHYLLILGCKQPKIHPRDKIGQQVGLLPSAHLGIYSGADQRSWSATKLFLVQRPKARTKKSRRVWSFGPDDTSSNGRRPFDLYRMMAFGHHALRVSGLRPLTSLAIYFGS